MFRLIRLLSFLIGLLKYRRLVSSAKWRTLQYFIACLHHAIWGTPYLNIAWLELNPVIETN